MDAFLLKNNGHPKKEWGVLERDILVFDGMKAGPGKEILPPLSPPPSSLRVPVENHDVFLRNKKSLRVPAPDDNLF